MKHKRFYSFLAVSLILFTLLMLMTLREARAQPPYIVTFNQNGLDGDAGSNTVLTFNQTNYAWNNLPNAFEVDDDVTTFTWAHTVAGISGEQFVETGDNGGLTSPITASGTDVADYTTQYLVTFSSSGLDADATGNLVSFTVTGGSYSGATSPIGVSGGFIWVDNGATVTYNFINVTSSITGKQYRFESVSGSASPITVSGATTLTGVYVTQYQLTVTSAYGTTTGQGWYDIGSTAYAGLTSGNVSGGTGTQHAFTSWGSDASGTNYAQSNPITMSGPMTATANWQTQYQVTFTQTGLDSDADSDIVLTLAGTPYGWSNLPSNYWVNSGSIFAWTINVSVSSGEQFFKTGGSGSLTSPIQTYGTSSATYQKQYYLTVSSTFDTATPGTGWFDPGSVTESVTSPFSGGSGTQYLCTGWTGSGSVPASGSVSSVTFTISAGSSITWNWKTQYQVTFSQSGVASDFSGTVVAVEGIDYGVSNLPVSFWYDSGFSPTFAFTSYLAVGATTKQYVYTSTSGGLTIGQSGSLTVTSGGSVIGNYKTQYYLNVSSPYDSPFPQSGFFDSGSGITESVTSPASGGQYVCTGWTGTGSVPSSGTSTSVTFTIMAPSSITWVWQSSVGQLTLTISSLHDSPNPTVGQHLYTNGSSVTCIVVSPVTEGDNVWTCTGWTGTGSVPTTGSNTVVTFTITQDSTITWNWVSAPITHNLTVASAHDSPNPSVGVHSYNDGASVTCNVSSSVVENGTLWTCTGWTGTGSVPAVGSGTSATFTITQDSSITWNWQGSPLQYTLTVNSLHDSPIPNGGQHVYNAGSNVICNVTNSVTEGTTVWICTGWTGTGSVPSSGNGDSVTFTINRNSSITWNWHNSTVQQYDLTVASQHGNPSPASGDHLYDDNDNVTCIVISPVNENGTTYVCTGWSGTGSVPSSGTDTSLTFIITQNSTITWNWQVALWTLTVISAYGSPTPSVGNHIISDGSYVTCNVSSPVIDAGISYTCTGWSGTGSVQASGNGTSTAFIITLNSTITWNWVVTPSVQRDLTVSSAHGNPSPSVGDHLVSDGDSVTCTVTSPVNESGTVWTCTGWSGSGSVPSTGTTTSVTFSITENSTITWNWVTVSPVKWKLTVVSAHGNPSPSVGDHSYSDGTTLSCNVSSPVVEKGVSYVCTGWTGTGSVPSSGSGTSTSFTLTENSTINWTWQIQSTIQSCDNMSNKKDVFSPGETVYITGTGYAEDQTYSIYFVNATTWVNGMAIPERIQGTATSVSTDSSGVIHLTLVCNETLMQGYYDILINVNGTSTYDAKADVLSYRVQVSPQAQSSSEYARFGTILGLIGCFAALGVFRIYKRKQQ